MEQRRSRRGNTERERFGNSTFVLFICLSLTSLLCCLSQHQSFAHNQEQLKHYAKRFFFLFIPCPNHCTSLSIIPAQSIQSSTLNKWPAWTRLEVEGWHLCFISAPALCSNTLIPQIPALNIFIQELWKMYSCFQKDYLMQVKLGWGVGRKEGG